MSELSELQAKFSLTGFDPTTKSKISDSDVLGEEKSPLFAEYFTFFVEQYLTDGRVIETNPFEMVDEDEWIKLMTVNYLESKGIVFPINNAETKFRMTWYGYKIMNQGGFAKAMKSGDRMQLEGFKIDEFKKSRKESTNSRLAEETHELVKKTNQFTKWVAFGTIGSLIAGLIGLGLWTWNIQVDIQTGQSIQQGFENMENQ